MLRRSLVACALFFVACSRETPKPTSSPAAPASSAPSATGAASASAIPTGTGLRLDVAAVQGARVDAIQLTLTVVNTSRATFRGAWFRPLLFGVEATDGAGAHVPITIPSWDAPVERVELVLAPGESKVLPNEVTFKFDPSGRGSSSPFEWVITSKRAPVLLTVTVGLESATVRGTVQL